jgi:hypothetical protein
MMLICARCGRKHPLTEDDIAFFHPRFFCLSCGEKLPFPLDDARVQELRHLNDRGRVLDADDLKALDGQDPVRKIHKGTAGGESSGG